jgi:hypothetical protein
MKSIIIKLLERLEIPDSNLLSSSGDELGSTNLLTVIRK